MRRPKAWTALTALLVALTLGARLPGLLQDALWQDEIGTARVAVQPSFRAALDQVVSRESTPPVFYGGVWVSAHAVWLVRSAAFPFAGLRVISLLCSAVVTLATFLVARRIMTRWAAFLAGVLVALASELVVHGAELRAYSLFVLVCVAFAVTLERAVRNPTLGSGAALAGAVALGSLTHYFFLFSLAAGVVWTASVTRERRVWRRTGLALGAGLVPFLVWTPFFWRQYRHGYYRWPHAISLRGAARLYPDLFFPSPYVTAAGVGLQVAFVAAILGGSLALWRRPDARLWALLAVFPMLLSVLVWGVGLRIVDTRNLVGTAPFAGVALAGGLAAVPRVEAARLAGAVLAGLCVAGFVAGEVGLGRTPYDRLASTLEREGWANDDPIVFFGRYAGVIPVAWYLTADAPRRPTSRVTEGTPSGGTCGAVYVVAWNRAGRRWLRHNDVYVTTRATVPSYGYVPRGRRGVNDVVVARLGWRGGILDRARAAGALLFFRSGASSPCLVAMPKA